MLKTKGCRVNIHSGHPSLSAGGGEVNLLPNFYKRRGDTWHNLNFWRGVGGKEEVNFFFWGGGVRGGCKFYIKTFIDKKVFLCRN